MLSLLRELLACLSIGALLGWQMPWLPHRLAQPLIRWGVPFSLAALLLRAELSHALLRIGLLGLFVPVVSLCLVSWSPLHGQIRHRVLRLGAAVGNTGYWGLPVVVALLPPESVASAAIYDLAGTFITWGLGPLVLTGLPRAGLLQRALTSPALQGFLLAAVIRQTPWRAMLAQMLWWPARAVFVVALVLVGMRLGLTIRQRSLVVGEGISWALAFKLLVVPALVWLVGGVALLPPADRQALVLQGAAPTALSVLLLAEAEQEDVPLAASIVLSSTVLAMLTVPLWWGLIR